MPPQPPQPPPTVDHNQQLQVWASKLSGNRVAVVLVNAFEGNQAGKPGWHAGPCNITAHWVDIFLEPGAVVHVRDAVHGVDLGRAAGSVSARVDVHDAAVLVLTPTAP